VAAVLDESSPCFLAFLGCTVEITVNLLVKQCTTFNDLFHIVITIQARCFCTMSGAKLLQLLVELVANLVLL